MLNTINKKHMSSKDRKVLKQLKSILKKNYSKSVSNTLEVSISKNI